MKKQNFELKNDKIHAAFLDMKEKQPERLKQRLNLSWSNWGFGMEQCRSEETNWQLPKGYIRKGLPPVRLVFFNFIGNPKCPSEGLQSLHIAWRKIL